MPNPATTLKVAKTAQYEHYITLGWVPRLALFFCLLVNKTSYFNLKSIKISRARESESVLVLIFEKSFFNFCLRRSIEALEWQLAITTGASLSNLRNKLKVVCQWQVLPVSLGFVGEVRSEKGVEKTMTCFSPF